MFGPLFSLLFRAINRVINNVDSVDHSHFRISLGYIKTPDVPHHLQAKSLPQSSQTNNFFFLTTNLSIKHSSSTTTKRNAFHLRCSSSCSCLCCLRSPSIERRTCCVSLHFHFELTVSSIVAREAEAEAEPVACNPSMPGCG